MEGAESEAESDSGVAPSLASSQSAESEARAAPPPAAADDKRRSARRKELVTLLSDLLFLFVVFYNAFLFLFCQMK